jgi:hypothetical protein
MALQVGASIRQLLLALSLVGMGAAGCLSIQAAIRALIPNVKPLPSAVSAAELATRMPEIDELRRLHGSVLSGTLLEREGDPTVALEPHRQPQDYVDLLRREARRLDGLAADAEDCYQFARADEIRGRASGLRESARENGGGPFSITVNR